MKVKLRQIVDAWPAFSVFSNALSKELDEKDADKQRTCLKATAKERYSVGKLLKAVNREHVEYQEARNAAVKKFGEKKKVPGQNGQPSEVLAVKDEHEEAFNAEIKELLDREVDLGEVVVIPWSYVEKVNPVPAVMADLIDFMEKAPG